METWTDTFSHHNPRQFLINVQATMDHLVATEDTDNNYQITIEDGGPKVGVTSFSNIMDC